MQGKFYPFVSLILLLSLLLSPLAAPPARAALGHAGSPPSLPGRVLDELTRLSSETGAGPVTNPLELSEPYFSEDFSGEVFPPPGWTVYNLDGGEPNWERAVDDFVSSPASAAHKFNVPSQSYQTGWLVTPAITLPDQDMVLFFFYERTQRPKFYHKQEVYFSTGSCNPSEGDFNLLGEIKGSGTWRRINIDMTGYGGETVCFGFLYEGNRASRWLLDDVLIWVTIYNLSLEAPLPAKNGLPGEIVEYDLTLTNTGTAEDTYHLSHEGAEWWVSLSETEVTLEVGDSYPLTAYVEVPSGALPGDWDAFVVRAVSEGDGMVSSDVELTTTYAADYALNLIADVTELSGLPGETVIYDLTLTNVGNGSDIFNLSYTGAEWDVVLSQQEVTLAAGASADFTASVVVPAGAFAGDWDAFNVNAVSQGDGSATGQVTLTTTASGDYGLTLNADEIELTGLPGETVVYDLTLTNTGNDSDTFNLSFTGASWEVTLSLEDVTLTAGESAGFTASVVVPLDALAGEWDAFTVDAISQADNEITGEVELITTAGSVYGLTLIADETELTGLPGETVVYDLTLTNLGNDSDTFDLSFTGALWEVSLSEDEVTLAAGESAPFTASVLVPEYALAGDWDAFTVRAVSQTDAAVSAEVELTTTAGAVYGLSLSANFTEKTGLSGDMVEYVLTLTNLGNTSDTFNLSQAGALWDVTLSHPDFTLGAGASAELTAQAAIPAEAGDGDWDSVLVAAASTGSPDLTAEVTLTTTVVLAPVAGFEPSAMFVLVGEEVAFTNTTIGAEPLTYLWDFGDGGASSEIHPTHTFLEEDEYTVSLTASNPFGESTYELVIHAGYAPSAAFTASHEVAIVGETISFTNASTGTAPLQYTWDFGHGSGSSAVNPSKSYPQPGLYTVNLSVVNPYGEDQASLEILVVPAAPVGADLELTLQVDPLPVRINQPVTITATVTNHGPALATGVAASGEIPEFVIFVGASPDCTEEEGYLTCDLGEIAPGESAEAWITLIFTQAGTFEAVLGAAGLELDPHLENNQATAAILVEMNTIYLPLMVRP